MTPQIHVVPFNDLKPHVISVSQACWCTPKVQNEGEGHLVMIHNPQAPVVQGHQLDVRKLMVTDQGFNQLST